MTHVLQAEEQNKTHAHDLCSCGKDLCVCLRYYAPDNTIKVISSPSVSLLALFLDRRRPPKTKSTCIPVNPPVPDNCHS